MNIVLAGIDLPDDLYWSDELTPWRVGQMVTPTLSGAVNIQQGVLLAGRPITFETRREGRAYVGAPTRATVLALLALADTTATGVMTLSVPTLDGPAQTLQVRWRHTDGPALECAPLVHRVPPQPGDRYSITLRLMQV